MAETSVGFQSALTGLPGDMPIARRVGDTGATGSGAMDPVAGLAAQMQRNLSHSSLHNSSELSLPPEGTGNGLSGSQQILGSQSSLQGLDPTHDQTLEAPPRSTDLSGREAVGRAPGVPVRHEGGEDMLANALGGLELSDRESRLGSSGGTAGLRRPGSHSSLSHGSGLHADDCLESEVQPRTIIIHNLIETVSDEDLQKDLESYGDVQTLYTGTKSQGKVMVTFFDCVAAARARAALDGRQVNGRLLQVDFHASQKDAQQGRVFVFNVADSVSDETVKAQMEVYGSIMFMHKHPAVPFCREIYFHDVRAANRAYNAIYPNPGGVPTISENGNDLGQQAIPMGMRTAHSSHALHSYNSGGGASAAQEADQDWGRPRSWDNAVQPADLARMMAQSGQNYTHPDVLALLQQAPPDTLDQLVRSGYLPNKGSSSSLQGLAHGLGSSAALRSLDSQQGSATNLSGLGGMSGSASHPDLAAAFIQAQSDSPDRMGGAQPMGATAPLPQMTGPSPQLTASQVAALQSSGLLGGLSQASMANARRRGMSTPDLTALAQIAQVSGGLQGYGVPNQGNQMWNSGGQYSAAELSGWGTNLNASGLQSANLDAAALLATQGGMNLGGFGAMQRSMSALQLQQLQQQQQQQLLLQLTGVTPQALVQLTNMRPPGPQPAGLSRGKAHRSDDNLAGGRLSRRAADPAVEAERKAQQERHFALDEGRVERREDTRTTLMIKNIPNKYTQKMLLQTIDEQFSRMYDFFYLPIDFKNKCNVGYAFINMVKPIYILPLMKRFNQRKWERFNSEKVCHISYARIQGKAQLVTHFQNSSLLHEDKRCRPILFKSDGELAAEPEPFPTATTSTRGHRPRPFSAGHPDAS